MKVLVIGGTRGLGRAVVVAAHGAGHTLTVMARHAAAFAEPISGLRMVVGDAEDADDVERATHGQDAVVWTVSAPGVRREVVVFSRGTHHLLAAMKQHGVRRLLCVTGSGTAPAAGRGILASQFARPRIPKGVALDKERQEDMVRDSGTDWTLVRPSALSRTRSTGLYQTLGAPPDGHAKRISRADVAGFIVENLDDPEYVRKTVVLTG